jgi:hypothetical protein
MAMYLPCRTSLVAAFLLVAAPFARAQTPVDPSGHWEGSIQIPGTELNIEVDLTKNSQGGITGTLGSSEQKGFPLATAAIKGQSISFHARVDQPFEGVLSADGQSISGTATLEGFPLPFRLTRRGDPRIEAPARSAPIGKELEGTWNGTLDVNGRGLRFVLTMSNHPDGTSTGSLVSLDEGELKVPVAITETAAGLTLELKPVGSSYAGALNKEGTELVGTFRQGTFAVPLTFRRQP